MGNQGFGFGTGAVSFGIVMAYASSTRSVVVQFGSPALFASGFRQGDALNPQSWSCWAVNSLGATTQQFSVIAVRPGPATFTAGTAVEVLLLDEFQPVNVLNWIACSTVLSAAGQLIQQPNQASFYGVQKTGVLTGSTRRVRGDLAQRAAQVDSVEALSGTLVVGPDRDYARQYGTPLLKKLVERRLFTPKGGFFHLPEYGLGQKIKEPFNPARAVPLKQEIQQQVCLEPEAQSCTARLTFSPVGQLNIGLTVYEVNNRNPTKWDVPVPQAIDL